MKRLILTTLFLAFAPAALHAQTDAMPPETKAPAKAMAEMPMPAKPPVPPSKFVTITFQGKSTTLSLPYLVNMPNQVTVKVHNAHRNTDETYTGPLVSDVLAKAGLSPAHENEAIILHSTIVATGSDNYFVLYSAAELEPAFTTGQSIIAIMKAGLPDTEGGLIQLINANAAKPARWVHGLTQLTVTTLAPTK